MADLNTVLKEAAPTTSLQNYMDVKNISLCLLLSSLDITDIVKHVDTTFTMINISISNMPYNE